MQKDHDDPPDAAGEIVAIWESPAAAHEHALVVLAMGIECGVYREQGGYTVRADSQQVDAIREEWRLYEAESQSPPEPGMDAVGGSNRPGAIVAWSLLLLVVHLAQLRDPSLSGRFCNSSHGVMIDAEIWRPFSAMFLHADGAHLAGNVLIGGIFLWFLGSTLGSLRGGCLMLACGTLANLANAALKMPEAFLSLGASTATFGALGILVGHATRVAWGARTFRGLRMMFVPLVAGAILLGWFGGGGADPENIDVAGHVLAWLFGAIGGFIWGKTPGVRQPARIHP